MRQNIHLLEALVFFIGLHQASAQVTFAPAASYPVSHIASVTAADINGDGKVDLICPNITAPGSITILTNDGIGGFMPASTPGGGNYPAVCVAADISGKGRVDLITANPYTSSPQPYSFNGNTLTVLTNNGSGVFASNATCTVGSGAISVVAADISGDGGVDLISANYNDGTVTVLTNNGAGGFGFNATCSVGSGPNFVVAADVNGDGAVDLIAANGGTVTQGNTLTVLTNNGDGVLSSNATCTVGAGPFGLAAADINGDGKVDLISANLGSGGNGSTLTVLTNNGSGGFVLSSSPSVGSSPYWVTAADVNGDGLLDLISANIGYGTLTVLTNDDGGGFVLAASPNVGGNPYAVVAADINGDGKLDLIAGPCGASATYASVLVNNTTFPPPTSTPALNLKRSGGGMFVSWPSASAGWSLQQNPDLKTSNWSPSGYSGYNISDDGTNKSLTFPSSVGNMFFRLLHP